MIGPTLKKRQEERRALVSILSHQQKVIAGMQARLPYSIYQKVPGKILVSRPRVSWIYDQYTPKQIMPELSKAKPAASK